MQSQCPIFSSDKCHCHYSIVTILPSQACGTVDVSVCSGHGRTAGGDICLAQPLKAERGMSR